MSYHTNFVNPLKPNSSIHYTLPYMPNLPFLISDILALWRSGLSARAVIYSLTEIETEIISKRKVVAYWPVVSAKVQYSHSAYYQ